MEKMKMDSKIDFNPRCTEHVGHGGFAQVFKEPGALIGIRKPWVAVKRILKGHSNAPFAIEKDEIVREIVTAADLMKEQSDLFVEFFGWSEDDNFVFLAMEYVELGDLKANSHSPWAEHDTKLIMHQLLEGLVKMHRENIAHRDLKPQNILLISRDPPRVKIGDFGISKRVPKDSSTRYDTRYSSGGYCAPEITKGKAKEQYTKAVDLWSLGCIMYEMVVGERLFRDDVHAAYEYGDIISGLESTMSRKFSEYGMSLLMSLIANNPAERPNAEEALSHIWFR
ncbi:hypothetical protein N7533_011534 [Penicillium manginii]|uniref:uncharacterized protein n=1 Tax=Penicillium manginii TaxID=203109 RepID=UPI0025496BB1|nr:uncharacterized protein N7533_011534 [Penicillium manginii]KAJ5742125.1 hypothetical protein N7533_011534 [Penicillium manginii]